MEVVFMEQPVQLHNKALCILIITVSSMLRCGHNSNVVPPLFINANEKKCVTRQGITSYNNKPFSGWQFALYDNGDTVWITPYINGKENGEAKGWFPNKQLMEIRVYEEGRKSGLHKGWWPNGKQKFEYHFANDMYEGSVREWYVSGKLFKSFNYKDGQENGLQQQYFPDGTLQFNYESKKGRNYGLTGVKNCVNVSDSIGLVQKK
jgi:antitoxin component YwqK of YwqJK toxin-antitoxin module